MKMQEIPEPVGKMIIDSKLGEMTLNGLYVQYTDVVTLMKRYSKSQLSALKKENEELKSAIKKYYIRSGSITIYWDDLNENEQEVLTNIKTDK